MTAKLDIEYIEIRNFLSYGDYDTHLDVANLGPVLMLGEVEVESESDGDSVSSNGAGKSSLLSAFIWCLFGRTVANPSPGDRVINWFVKKNCHVKIKTSDGWEIIRTRNFDGHSELILRKDEFDETKSTNTNAQKKLEELFGLNYEIFTSSVFCGQFGKSFLEMSPVKRKETIEKLLGLNRLNKFADTAKVQYKQIETKQSIVRTKIDLFGTDIDRQENKLVKDFKSKNQFEVSRQNRLDQIKLKIGEIEVEMDGLKIPNIKKLEKQWELTNAIIEKVSQYQDEIKENQLRAELLAKEIAQGNKNRSDGWPHEVPDVDELKATHMKAMEAGAHLQLISEELLTIQGKIHCLGQDIDRNYEKVKQWKNKSDTDCESCGQEIGLDHIEKTISSVQTTLNLDNANQNSFKKKQSKLIQISEILKAVPLPTISIEEAERLIKLNETIAKDVEEVAHQQDAKKKEKDNLLIKNQKFDDIVGQAISKLSQIKPKMSLEDVGHLQSKHGILEQRKSDFNERADELNVEVNPYDNIIIDLEKALENLKKESDDLKNEIEQLDILFKHYKYIHRSYSDRRKIKGWLLSELIPFLNDRIYYYLDMFGVDMIIKFNSTLGVETDKWGYEFCSGGERKRIDLAIMFSLYDLYMSIYGQQCNIMVLDEVDSRLDRQGVEAFSDVINNICANSERSKPSTIFVISHKQELQSMFPSQITIKKQGTFSSIDQTAFLVDQK